MVIVIVAFWVIVMVAELVKGNFDVIVIDFVIIITKADFKTQLDQLFLLLLITEQLIGGFNDQSTFRFLDSMAHFRVRLTSSAFSSLDKN